LFDYDDDGWLDVYLLQNAGPESKAVNRLFRQSGPGTFVDVTAGSGLDERGWGMGVAAGDVNNDGRVDLVVTEYGKARLFLNAGHGLRPRFVDVSAAAGMENPFWGTSTALVDYDRDGWLDLVLVNYVSYDPSRPCSGEDGRPDFCGPKAFPRRVTKLFRNLGPGGDRAAEPRTVRFEDRTIPSGLAARAGPGLGVFCADFDGDRWPDIFVANDGEPNHLWINQRDGTFKEDGAARGIAVNSMGMAEANMGVAIGDVNGDDLFDVFVTHLTTETHTLWMQQPRGAFQDRTVASRVPAAAWRGTGFGTVLLDADNDGHLDLAIANGRVKRPMSAPPSVPRLDPFWQTYAERNQLLRGDGQGMFTDVSQANPALSGEAGVSRGLACADLDNDGGLDLLVTRIAAPVQLLKNVAPRRGHWLLVRAVDPRLSRDACGAEIHLRAGTRRWMRWANPGYSYLCSNDPRAHFGLGTADRYDRIEVVWPDGARERFPGGPADRQVVLRRGEGEAVDP
jgi:hypothetical protein